MKKNRVLIILAVLALAFSCNGTQERGSASDLLRTVPSDALVVMDFERCSDALQVMLDSTNAIHNLDLSGLEDVHCVLSYVYTGSVQPILALDMGKAPADTTEAVSGLLRNASGLGLQARFFADGWSEGENAAIIITSSVATMPAVMRHIEGYTSIFDAPGFREAAALPSSGRGTIYIRNSGFDKILPKTFLKGTLDRRRMLAFLQKSTDWTVASVVGGGSFDIETVQNDSKVHYVNVLSSLPTGESRLGDVLPADADLALAQPVVAGFREQYEAYQDASVKLDKYQKAVSELKSAAGKSPLAWEKEMDIREVALVFWNGRKVALVRSARAVDGNIRSNPYKGFPAILYGDAFSLADDFCADVDGWRVSGSQEDVSAFLDCTERLGGDDWQYRNCHFVVYRQNRRLCWDSKGLKYGIQITE